MGLFYIYQTSSLPTGRGLFMTSAVALIWVENDLCCNSFFSSHGSFLISFPMCPKFIVNSGSVMQCYAARYTRVAV